jgi:hypothetical protein
VLPPVLFLLLEDRLLILGGSEDVRSRGYCGRGFPYPYPDGFVVSWRSLPPYWRRLFCSELAEAIL